MRYKIYLTSEDKKHDHYIETDGTRPPSVAIKKALKAAGLPENIRYYDLEAIRESEE